MQDPKHDINKEKKKNPNNNKIKAFTSTTFFLSAASAALSLPIATGTSVAKEMKLKPHDGRKRLAHNTQRPLVPPCPAALLNAHQPNAIRNHAPGGIAEDSKSGPASLACSDGRISSTYAFTRANSRTKAPRRTSRSSARCGSCFDRSLPWSKGRGEKGGGDENARTETPNQKNNKAPC